VKQNPLKMGLLNQMVNNDFLCKKCRYSFISSYTRKSYERDCDKKIIRLLREGCGTLGIGRILLISPKTVASKILKIADSIQHPPIVFGREYEVDELITYVGCKDRRICLVYALDRKTKNVVSFAVGRRNKTTLRMVINSLILSDAQEIRTDKLNLYQTLVPEGIHHVKQRGINFIERNNLTCKSQDNSGQITSVYRIILKYN
jgi:insertion element IS1 protein InsB